MGKNMVNIIQRPPSFGEQFGKALGGGLGKGFSSGVESGIDFKHQLKLQEAKLKKDTQSAKEAERQKTFQGLETTLTHMEGLLGKSGIGFGSGFNPSDEAMYNRGRMQTLSSDLLSFYKTLFPRGITQEEFKRLERDYIPKPGEREATQHGKIDAFRDLIKSKMQEMSSGEEISGSMPETSKKKEFETPGQEYKKTQLKKVKPGTELTLDVVKSLQKKTQGDKKKALQLARELGYNVD